MRMWDRTSRYAVDVDATTLTKRDTLILPESVQ